MKILPDWLKDGYLRVIDPVADWLVRRGVHPNTITAIGTACTIIAAVIFAMGHIRTAGWFLGLTALFDVLEWPASRASAADSPSRSARSRRWRRFASASAPRTARR